MFLTNFSPQLQKRLSTQNESDIIISLNAVKNKGARVGLLYRDFEIEAKQKDENNIFRAKITPEELESAAQPLVELLRKKGHPHMTVLVTDWNVELVEALSGIPMPYDD